MNISSFTTLDYALAIFLFIVTFKGWRRGLIVSFFSIVGAIAGAIAGYHLLHYFSPTQSDTEVVRWGTQATLLIVSFSVGSSIGSFIGRRITKALDWDSFQFLDKLLGLTLSFVGWSLVIWTVLTTALVLPVSSVTNNIRQSEILQYIDNNIPDNVRTTIDNWRDIESLSFDLSNTGN